MLWAILIIVILILLSLNNNCNVKITADKKIKVHLILDQGLMNKFEKFVEWERLPAQGEFARLGWFSSGDDWVIYKIIRIVYIDDKHSEIYLERT